MCDEGGQFLFFCCFSAWGYVSSIIYSSVCNIEIDAFVFRMVCFLYGIHMIQQQPDVKIAYDNIRNLQKIGKARKIG